MGRTPSRARAFIERLRDVLRNSGGQYDLSGPDRVVIGEPAAPESPPRVHLVDAAISARPDDQLGAYRRTLTVGLVCYVGAENDSTEERALNAIDLVDDLTSALEDDWKNHQFNDNAVGFVVRDMQFADGLAMDVQGMGVASLVIELDYITPSGVGL